MQTVGEILWAAGKLREVASALERLGRQLTSKAVHARMAGTIADGRIPEAHESPPAGALELPSAEQLPIWRDVDEV